MKCKAFLRVLGDSTLIVGVVRKKLVETDSFADVEIGKPSAVDPSNGKTNGFHLDRVVTNFLKVSTTLDRRSIDMIHEHRKLVPDESPTAVARKEEIGEFLRSRVGRFYETYEDEVLSRIIDKWRKARGDCKYLIWDEIDEIERKILAALGLD